MRKQPLRIDTKFPTTVKKYHIINSPFTRSSLQISRYSLKQSNSPKNVFTTRKQAISNLIKSAKVSLVAPQQEIVNSISYGINEVRIKKSELRKPLVTSMRLCNSLPNLLCALIESSYKTREMYCEKAKLEKTIRCNKIQLNSRLISPRIRSPPVQKDIARISGVKEPPIQIICKKINSRKSTLTAWSRSTDSAKD